MAGFRTDLDEHFLYKLPADGSCAQASCAIWTRQLPAFGIGVPFNFGVITTALAVGTIGTKPVLAVGLNTADRALTKPGGTALPSGIYVVDQADGSVLGTYTGYSTPGVLTPVTALAWDDNGSGLLAIGTLAFGDRGHAVRVSAAGTFANLTAWTNPTPSLSGPFPLSAAVGHRPDGSSVVAFGTDDGSVKLWDPAVSSSNLLSQVTGSDAVNALTFTDRIDGTVGVPDLVAASSRGNSARVLRYSGATTLTPLAVAPPGRHVDRHRRDPRLVPRLQDRCGDVRQQHPERPEDPARLRDAAQRRLRLLVRPGLRRPSRLADHVGDPGQSDLAHLHRRHADRR